MKRRSVQIARALQQMSFHRCKYCTPARKNGHKITSDWVGVENRFGETCKVKRYTLKKEE